MEILNPDRRIFFLAVNTGYTSNGTPERRLLDFYSERSGNGLYCAIIGNVAIPDGHGTNGSTPQIKQLSIWKEIAEAISKKETFPGIQLSTTWDGYNGNRNFITKTPEEEIARYKKVASCFEGSYIRSKFRSLEEATKICIDSGFKHIQHTDISSISFLTADFLSTTSWRKS
jgi:2,4-dienoyl-CoA reductase-like NADH-dependent reductase (Old Yellow Enzyme family)